MIPIKAYVRLIVEYLRPLRARVLLLTAVLAAAIAFQLANPQLVRSFIDAAIEGEGSGRLIGFAAWFMVLAVGHQVLSVFATYLAEDIGWTATNEMRAKLAEHILDLDMSFHKAHTPGELIERIDGDVTALSNFFSAFAIKVVANAVLIVGILALIWRENVWVGVGMTLFSIVAMLALLTINSRAMPAWRKVRARSAEFFGFVGEQLGGTEDVRANGATGYMLHRFTRILRSWLPESVRARMGFAALWATNIFSYLLGTALVFWLGSVLFGNGSLTLGSVYLIFHYTEMTRHPLDQIRAQLEDFQKASAGISRVEELFERQSVLPAGGKTVLPQGALRVSLDHVTFAYDDVHGSDDIVLHDVTFEVGEGRILGILGRTGSGKTTLARLLTRLYDPTHGDLRLDGVGLREANLSELRKRVGMVTQDVQLFRASIRDNLTFFDQSISDDRLLEALHQLELDEWLASLRHGLDSELESGGGGLSAGQAQLLAFTRIFLRDPGLLILDEASSRLDPATENLIEHAVGRLMENRTGFVIAHRLATVTRADDILVMEDGRVVEFGERVDLMADPNSRFSSLLATGMEELLT